MSQDPLGLGAGENVYSYTLNSFSWCDPLGLCSKKSGGGIQYELNKSVSELIETGYLKRM